METEPELITIIEGPPPDFRMAAEPWALSMLEADKPFYVSLCQVRSFKGQALLERCRRAWSSQRPIYLDFPTMSGIRRKLEIVAARFEQLPEGDMLNLWVRHEPGDLEEMAPPSDAE